MPKIFESPDKGQTVYAREFGGEQRQLHIQSPQAIGIIDQLAEDKLWGDIRRNAKTQPALQDALDRVIIIYELGKTNE